MKRSTGYPGVDEQRRLDAAGLCHRVPQPVCLCPGHAQREPVTGTAMFKAVVMHVVLMILLFQCFKFIRRTWDAQLSDFPIVV